ncbi:NADH:flavin oxidoreductase/NADH oxidase [Phellopilus nigrolimitatus]|nr:NADH:flavin oxidoreductase/NADH oxidase [Phellopilus nigrolimitatus]
MAHPDAALFQPIRVGNLALQHRVVLAPLTRFRADDAHVPTDIMADYYAQRASVPGTLLVTEGTFIAPKAAGQPNVPGVWSDAQVAAWKKVVDGVHARGSFIYLQMWPLGRAAFPDTLASVDARANPGGPHPYVSASDVPLSDKKGVVPRPLSHAEILEYIDLFGTAAHNAVHGAGFDGVEIHGAHGYLVDQFTQDVSNKRTDQWGGSIENRTRFALEVIKRVTSVVGEERTAIRLSPFSTFQDMRMADPVPTFSHLVRRIRESYPRFSYINIVEPRAAGDQDREAQAGESTDFLRAIWQTPESERNGSVYVSAGGYKPESALETAQAKGGLVVFGRWFLANPDLPARIKKGLPLTQYDRKTFYTPKNPRGYNDYPFADPEAEANHKRAGSPLARLAGKLTSLL